uniref:Uncharacterized protein n=1 Tax=Medicago truncatula TaxID=3880 RepID=Q1S5M4_MEDTR|nr:hypothetical protein MtrDRAFT_AC147431g49v2 [Medicago truncatula]
MAYFSVGDLTQQLFINHPPYGYMKHRSENKEMNALELRPRVVYIQHPHSSNQRGAFYKGKHREGLTSKADNTSERSVAYLRVEGNSDYV